jgi:hypothetical protein
MGRGTKWAVIGALLFVALGAGWYFASPWWTLREMKLAAEAGDADRFASYVDFPAVREDAKAEILARLTAQTQKDDSAFGALGMALGTAMVGPIVDQMVSPAGLRAAFIVKRNSPSAGRDKAPAGVHVAEEPVLVRRGFSEFMVASRERPKSGLVFTRHGLGWKLSGLDLPPEGGGEAGAGEQPQ